MPVLRANRVEPSTALRRSDRLARCSAPGYHALRMLKVCRFRKENGQVGCALHDEGGIRDLTSLGFTSLSAILEDPRDLSKINPAAERPMRAGEYSLLAPVENQEVWAAGVTYLRSKKARMEESEFSASAYDKVYEAPRPELFFKSLAAKVSGPNGPIGIRRDAKWNVPEPELALVINSRKELVGFTVGNDMSSRDIEGENLLYLPQAKIYRHSCALGPCITLAATEQDARTWTISLQILRAGSEVFKAETSVNQIKRNFAELIEYLWRSQEFPNGAILLTGTGIVPADDFTLRIGDVVRINISGIGTLENTVLEV
jgi:2-dehydro-3-deoxy-D-arabinonate dehydratase